MSLLDFTLPGSDPNRPNAFVQSPEQVAARLALAQQLSKGGSDYSPVQSPWQGAARLAQALAGAVGTYKGNEAMRLGTANAAADFGNALGADPGNLSIPATPGQTTPALQASDQRNDAMADAGGGNALAAALGGSPAPASTGGNSTLATALGAPPAAAGGGMAPYQAAIAKIESGGNYGATGPQTSTGDRAYGKYQVMGANIPQWTQAALGRPMTPQEFLANPQAQDAVFNHQFGGYVQKYGPQDAASMWLTGRTLANGGARAADLNGTTGQGYADQFTRNLGAAPASQAISAATGDPAQAAIGADAAEGNKYLDATAKARGMGHDISEQEAVRIATGGAPAYAPTSPAAGAAPGGPQGAGVPPSPAPLQAPSAGQQSGFHPEVQSLLNVLSDPWASPAQQQIAQSLLQSQMPVPPTIEKVKGQDGAEHIVFVNPRTGQVRDTGGVGIVATGGPGSLPAPPPGADVQKWREEQASIAAKEGSPTATNEMEFAQKLAERPSYKEYSAALPTWNAFTQHVQDNSPAADKAIVDDFAKILNPGRAVTTGAFQLNMDAQSIPAAIQSQIMKAWNGDGELGPDARAQMAKAAQAKMTEYKSAWSTDETQATKTARAHNLAVDRVIPQFPDLAALDLSKINRTKTAAPASVGGSAAPAAPPAPAPPPVGTISKGHRFIGGDPSKPSSWEPVI